MTYLTLTMNSPTSSWSMVCRISALVCIFSLLYCLLAASATRSSSSDWHPKPGQPPRTVAMSADESEAERYTPVSPCCGDLTWGVDSPLVEELADFLHGQRVVDDVQGTGAHFQSSVVLAPRRISLVEHLKHRHWRGIWRQQRKETTVWTTVKILLSSCHTKTLQSIFSSVELSVSFDSKRFEIIDSYPLLKQFVYMKVVYRHFPLETDQNTLLVNDYNNKM